MRINTTHVIVGGLAGAVDVVLERQDAQNARVEPFKTWTDWGRVGLLLLGYAGQSFNFYSGTMAALAQSELPLVVKSVAQLIPSGAGAPAAARTVSQPRATSPGRVGWRPKAI